MSTSRGLQRKDTSQHESMIHGRCTTIKRGFTSTVVYASNNVVIVKQKKDKERRERLLKRVVIGDSYSSVMAPFLWRHLMWRLRMGYRVNAEGEGRWRCKLTTRRPKGGLRRKTYCWFLYELQLIIPSHRLNSLESSIDVSHIGTGRSDCIITRQSLSYRSIWLADWAAWASDRSMEITSSRVSFLEWDVNKIHYE